VKFRIGSVDHEPDDLPAQLPLRGRLLRKIAGPPRRPEYWLAELDAPVTPPVRFPVSPAQRRLSRRREPAATRRQTSRASDAVRLRADNARGREQGGNKCGPSHGVLRSPVEWMLQPAATVTIESLPLQRSCDERQLVHVDRQAASVPETMTLVMSRSITRLPNYPITRCPIRLSAPNSSGRGPTS
jgi:hypothetical protein